MGNKKIAMVIASKDFQDEEYFITKSVLEKAGYQITTVSSKTGQGLGSFGGVVNIDLSATELKIEEYASLVFIGGAGMAKNLNFEPFQKLAQQGTSQNKIIGAICVAPAVLAKAGVLKGKKATVWTSDLNKSNVKILTENKAIYQAAPLVIDGNIVTADGPSQARKFGETIVRILTKD